MSYWKGAGMDSTDLIFPYLFLFVTMKLQTKNYPSSFTGRAFVVWVPTTLKITPLCQVNLNTNVCIFYPLTTCLGK